MKIKLGIILMLIFITGCFGLNGKYEKLEVKVIKNDISDSEEFSKLLFFNNGTTLDGIDPETDEIKVQYKFNHFINYGDVTEDGRVLLCDSGSVKYEGWGSKIFVINYKGKVLKEIDTIVNPAYLKIAGDKFFVSNEVFHGKGYTKIAVYDVNNYNEVKIFDDIKNDVSSIFVNDEYIFFNVYGTEHYKRANHILKINWETLEKEEIYKPFKDYPYNYSGSIKSENILFNTLKEVNEISIFDCVKNEEIKRIKIREIMDFPDNILELMNKPENKPGILNTNFWISNPIRIDDRVVVEFAYFSNKIKFGRFLFFDEKTYELLYVEDAYAGNSYYNAWARADYTSNDKIYFKNGKKVAIYNYVEKKWVKEIVCGEY